MKYPEYSHLNFKEIDQSILDYWRKESLFEKSVAQRSASPSFVFYEGPPSANGMPELHKLMPILGVLQDRGHAVALVTDGRLSGASGKVPAAIHITPEAAAGGAIGRIQDGDVISLNVASGELFLNIDEEVLASRSTADQPSPINTVGRGLFLLNREAVTDAECGGCSLFGPPILDPVPVLETPRAVAYEHCAS